MAPCSLPCLLPVDTPDSHGGPTCTVQVSTYWGADSHLLESMEWDPVTSGPTANCIPLAGVTFKAGVIVGRPMQKLDAIRKLAAAMVRSDTATRHLLHSWQALLNTPKEMDGCQHPNTHIFPALPLVSEGVVLFNFPTCELCVVCGVPLAAYPGIPHHLAEVGYPKLKN
jgi:hypothetical protein